MPTTESIAKVAHEANRAFCESLGDMSQKPWDQAEQWQRDSAIAGVRFRIDNPQAPADAQHNAWMSDKIKDGWQFGETKDATLKTHPCIVPYSALPKDQRLKDHLFVGVVTALLSEGQ